MVIIGIKLFALVILMKQLLTQSHGKYNYSQDYYGKQFTRPDHHDNTITYMATMMTQLLKVSIMTVQLLPLSLL